MNCISDEIIQKYIDGEVPEDESVLIKQHLESCKSCADRVEERIRLSENIKSAINSIVDNHQDIPAFDHGRKVSGKPSFIRKPVFIIASTVAAACIVLFILVFRTEQKTPAQRQLPQVSIYNYEIDANKPLSGQPLIIHVAGPDGKQMDYVIE